MSNSTFGKGLSAALPPIGAYYIIDLEIMRYAFSWKSRQLATIIPIFSSWISWQLAVIIPIFLDP
jgi:hypothetical protein